MWEVARYHRRTFRSIIWYIMLNTYYRDNYVCSRVKKFKNQMQISKIESNCLGSVSTLSKWYSLLNEEHGTTFMLSRTGNKRQFMSPACYSTVCSPQCVEIFLEGTCLSTFPPIPFNLIIILNIFYEKFGSMKITMLLQKGFHLIVLSFACSLLLLLKTFWRTLTVSCPLFYLEIKPFMTFKVAIFSQKTTITCNTTPTSIS